MDAAARQHRREQLREAQRRSRQRRQEALERLTEQNRQLTAEVQRIRQSVKDLVELAWDRWTTGDISNELLERLVALNNSFAQSGTSSAGEPMDMAQSSIASDSGSRSEVPSMPFAMSPDFSVFQDERLSYALEPSDFFTLDESSTTQSPQVTTSESQSNDPTERTVRPADVENNPESRHFAFCIPSIAYDCDCSSSWLVHIPRDFKVVHYSDCLLV